MVKSLHVTGAASRAQWMRMALLPTLLVRCIQGGAVPFRAAVLAWVAAMAVDALCQFLRQQEIKPGRDAVLTAWIVALSLPVDSPVWLAAAATVLAVGIGRHAFGGGALVVFHPAMVGIALLSLWLPGLQQFTVPVYANAWSMLWPALALTASGVALCWARLIRWQLPAAFLLAVSVVLIGGGYTLSSLLSVLMSVGLLAAFFIVAEPQTSPILPRPGMLFGLLTGALYGWTVLHSQPRLAEVVLLGNLLVPWLDRWALAEHSRRREQRQPS